MRERWVAWLSGLVLGLAVGCAPESPVDEGDEADVDAEMSEDELGTAGFDRHRVLSDAAFEDSGAMTTSEVQAFLNQTPYGNKSALANYTSGGMTAATAITKAATEHGINPLLILTRAQMEQSLIGKSSASKKALDFAFGCGCPDNQSCSETWRGFHKQVDCMASHMRSYLDDLDAGGSTIAGYKVGVAKKTLDPAWVTPKNRATAALYTYTPWVGTNGFGNLGHFQIWRKFAAHTGYVPDGPGGCAAVIYPSGLIAQSLPSDAMSEAYTTQLGLPSSVAPTCFLDPFQLVDPSTEATASASTQVSNNFKFSEFLAGEPQARHVLIEPALVTKLQSLRTSLATSVTVVEGFRSPEKHASLCGDQCEATLGLTLGRAARVKSSSSSQKMLNAAKNAGFTSCWMEGQELYVDVSSPGLGCPASP